MALPYTAFISHTIFSILFLEGAYNWELVEMHGQDFGISA